MANEGSEASTYYTENNFKEHY